MASLFDPNFKYTARAKNIYKELQSWLQPLYQELIEEGYSPREITNLVVNAATATENTLVVEWEEMQVVCHQNPLASGCSREGSAESLMNP
jgi:hypothetical protein